MVAPNFLVKLDCCQIFQDESLCLKWLQSFYHAISQNFFVIALFLLQWCYIVRIALHFLTFNQQIWILNLILSMNGWFTRWEISKENILTYASHCPALTSILARSYALESVCSSLHSASIDTSSQGRISPLIINEI